MNQPKQKKSFGKRLTRIVLKTILFVFLFLVLVILLILTPPVQNFLRKKTVTFLENKLQTRVQVGKIYIGFPKKVVIEDIYLEDRQKDTLLSGGLIKVDIALFKLIFKQEVDIGSVSLENITAKINRQLPDTLFNFQFIIDAFSPPTGAPAASAPDTTASNLSIRNITLDKARLVFNDVITGTDAEAWIDHFETKIDKIDPARAHLEIPRISINGMTARLYQVKPLAVPAPAAVTTDATVPVYPEMVFGEIDLKKINLDYRNDVSAMYTNAVIGSLLVEMKQLDFAERIVDFKTIALENSTANLRIGRKQEARILVEEVKEKTDSSIEKGWRLNIASFTSDQNNLQFDNDNLPRQRTGMDYAHLKATPFVLHAKDFFFAEDSIGGKIESASFREQSGFVLNELTADFLYTGNQAWLHDLYLETPGTQLKRNATIRYASLDALQKDLGNLYIDIDIADSRILVKDILSFVPSLRSQPAFADPGATWFINSQVQGRVADLNITSLQLRGLQDTRADIKGRITGLPNLDRFSANLIIKDISSSRRDINRFIPAGMLPKQISLPMRFNITGNLKGDTRDLDGELSVRTDLGDAVLKGNVKQLTDQRNASYNATVQTKSLDLGRLLQDTSLGPLTATVSVNGRGLDPKTAHADFNGAIHSAVFNQYTYRDLDLKGSLANQQAKLDASIVDPNIHVSLNATADLSGDYPAIQLSAMVDSLKTEALHLSSAPIIYRGKIDADFASTNPDDLDGTLYLTQSLLVQSDQRIQMDTVQLQASRSDSGHYIQLHSDIINARLEGNYRLTQLGTIFQQAIQPYFAVQPATRSAPEEAYDFTLSASVVNGQPLQAFLPELQRMDSLKLQSRFSATTGWTATVSAPALDYGSNHIRGLELKAGTNPGQDSIEADLQVTQINSGSMQFYNTSLATSIAGNTIRFTADTRDKADKSRYNFSGVIGQPSPGEYSFSFTPGGLLLNYEQWSIAPGNKILITRDNLVASDFVLSKSGQQLTLNSLSQNPGAPLEVKFNDFRLATITAFVQNDSTLVDGRLNGTVTFTDILTDPIFDGQLTITDLSVQNDTVGNAVININNTAQNTYAANAVISGRGNDVTLKGSYFANPAGNSSFDLDLDINRLPLTTVQAFSNGAIRSASGNVNGQFDITGTFERPVVKGDLNFDKAAFNYSMFNSYFRIDNEKIVVNENGIRFNRLEIRDSLDNRLVLDGEAVTINFMNYRFNFTVRANNFQALNSTKRNNKLFYGQLFFNSNLKVSGTETAPVVDGSITINEKTKMTVVLPQREPGVVQREGVVEFVDMDSPANDSLFLAAYDSLNTTPFMGMDITANIEVNKEAEFNLVIDEGNGDFLNVKGEALLTGGIDPSGKLTLAGSYELEQGSYELTFNFIRRKFNIQKGSRITWLGEPTDAEMDVTAIYVANVSPLDLVENQLGNEITATQRNTYLQKIPFDVLLKMEGKLLKPDISFDILLPEDKNYNVDNTILTTVRTKLELLRQEPGELNKQVFALMLLNRFIGENPFNSSTETLSASTMARQSVSKLLTEQLNRLTEDLIKGVDLNFDVISSEDYTTGERRDRTDLNVGLSKQLLNDRLTVSVGNNFELEGPQNSNQKPSNIAGNVALNYQISRDGRYMLRAYRKNEYEGIIDGYVIETGVSFIISVDYNRFRQLFIGKRQRQERREARRAAKQQQKAKENAEIKEANQPQP